MLKIRNNVDLKELEKYGFEREHCDEIMEYINSYIYKVDGESIWFHMDERIIYVGLEEDYFEVDEEILNKLYDLIKDGLVEKVERR